MGVEQISLCGTFAQLPENEFNWDSRPANHWFAKHDFGIDLNTFCNTFCACHNFLLLADDIIVIISWLEYFIQISSFGLRSHEGGVFLRRHIDVAIHVSVFQKFNLEFTPFRIIADRRNTRRVQRHAVHVFSLSTAGVIRFGFQSRVSRNISSSVRMLVQEF